MLVQDVDDLRRLHDAETKQPLCRLPCGIDVDSRRALYIEGKSYPASPPFHLPAGKDVTLEVRPGSYNKRYLGIAGVVLGGSFAIVGVTSASLDDGKQGLSFAISLPLLIAGTALCISSRTTCTIR